MASVLLKSHKNELYRLILLHELDPADFTWEPANDPTVYEFGDEAEHGGERLVYRPSGYWFFVGKDRQGRYCWYSPDGHHTETRLPEASPGHIELMFGSWLSYLKREYHPPDLWEGVKQQQQLLRAASAPDADNSPFTESELVHIRRRLDSLKEFLFQQAELSDSHRAFVTHRLNYVAEAASRSGRVDWLNLSLGVVVGIVVEIALDPQVARALWRLFTAGVRALFGGSELPQ